MSNTYEAVNDQGSVVTTGDIAGNHVGESLAKMPPESQCYMTCDINKKNAHNFIKYIYIYLESTCGGSWWGDHIYIYIHIDIKLATTASNVHMYQCHQMPALLSAPSWSRDVKSQNIH